MPKYGTHRRTARHNDWGKTYKAMSMALTNAGEKLNEIATVELQGVAENYLKKEDAQWPHGTTVQTLSKQNGLFVQGIQRFGGDHSHPWYSGQLHDSVAVRIMSKNRITSVHYMPPSPATGKPQHTETIKNIIGAEWAREVAEGGGARYFLPGVQIQLIVGVPYADKVNSEGRHRGFTDDLSANLFNDVYDWIDGGGLTRWFLRATPDGAKVVKGSHIKK